MALATFFVCYLRPTEGSEIKEGDLARAMNNEDCHAINWHPAGRLVQSKVGLSDETLALDSNELPFLGNLLSHLKTGQPRATLSKLIKNQLRGYWNRSLVRLKLKTFTINVYAIRRCGPSHACRRGFRSVAEVKKRGCSRADPRVVTKHTLVWSQSSRNWRLACSSEEGLLWRRSGIMLIVVASGL